MISKNVLASFALLLLFIVFSIHAPTLASAGRDSEKPSVSASLDLESRATDVVIGQVQGMETRWSEAENTIYTYVNITVEDLLKGDNATDKITVRYTGGEVGNVGLRDSLAPQFVDGERVKLFLTSISGTDEFAVVGGKQGEISLSQLASAGYLYAGYHWSASDLPVQYYINENGTPDIAGTTDEFLAIQRSFQTWEDDVGSYMDYTYAGTTQRAGFSRDGVNVVSWQHIDGPSGTLAETYYWYESTAKLLTEFDIVLDKDETWSVSGEAGKLDAQDICTHEVGHTLVLDDLYDPADSEQTMYGYSAVGETKKRDLYTGDIAGIRFIYGSSTVTYTIDANPAGLQINVDGTSYTTPHSFSWYTGTQHFVDAVPLQDSAQGKRYLFDKWSDYGTPFHSVSVGTNAYTLTAYYTAQYQISFTFKTDDSLQQVLPTRIKLMAASPNDTLMTLTNYSDVWLDDVQWTITEIIWNANNVVPLNHPIASLTLNFEWQVKTRVYPTRFQESFKDNTGLELPTSPSTFQLEFPNGTSSGSLNPEELYYFQNGTTSWNSILWLNGEVAPKSSAFDPSDGNPSVNCLVYDFTIRVTDPLGLPVLGASVSITTHNGATIESSTGTEGTAFLRLVPQGKFTAKISYLGQTTTIRGDVSEAASNPAEAQITFSPMVITLILVPAFVPCALVLAALKRRKRTT